MDALITELESRFSRITNQCYPLEWDENHITFSLMREMRETFTRRKVHYKGFTKIVEWFSYKNKSKRVESAVGDISLLVNIQFSTGESLKGVAFIEAKRDSDRDFFQSISLPQLERIHANAPYSQLLFYLHKSESLPLKFPDSGTWRSNMWASPINTALRKLQQVQTSDNMNTLRVSLPFSTFITARLFWGLDLDYREEARKLALEGLGNFTPPPFLGVINVHYEDQIPINEQLSDLWEVI